jgi:transitional endoplasmic reticulum ATPase
MNLNNVNLSDIADQTIGYTGADIKGLCREASLIALRKDQKTSIVVQ